jgi:putative ABC transport system permease protein
MQIRLASGRQFRRDDDERHPFVAIINETMAHALFPGESAIGKRLWTGAGNVERTIVGVVGDTYQYGLDGPRTMQLYVPHADNSGGDLTLVVRASDSRRAVESQLRDVVSDVDPGVPLDEVMTMDQVLAASAGRHRLLAGVSFAFAFGAIGLAAMGLFGVVAYSVTQRTPEIGLRMALGATSRAIVGRVLGDVGRLAAGGLLLGLIASLWLARAMSPLLFRITWTDPLAFTASSVLLFMVAFLAASAPAHRAATVDPTIALRGD